MGTLVHLSPAAWLFDLSGAAETPPKVCGHLYRRYELVEDGVSSEQTHNGTLQHDASCEAGGADMSLQSRFFRGIRELEAAADSDPAHILKGAVGEHVGLIQQALMALDGATIATPELSSKRYGSSTAHAVLAYKRKRRIINFSYQQQADDIVGKMTMASLDKGMLRLEKTLAANGIRCTFEGQGNSNA
jgi:hypothetical protein